ncbi:MAG: FliG C-terminal domain-containing protein [Elusimicrobiota bacterium]
MKKICTYLFLLYTLHFTLYTLLYSVDNIDREKLTLETNIEKRITDALSKLLSPQDFIVIVNIEPIIEELAKAKPREKLQIEQLTSPAETKKITKDYILPGVPTKKNLLEEEQKKPAAAPVQVIVPPAEKEIETLKKFIKKITVTIKFDRTIPDTIVAEARKLITGLVNFNTTRGDSLVIEKTEFYKKNIPWWQTIATLPSVLWISGVLLFAYFLFGPLNVFFKHLVSTLSTKPATPTPSLDNLIPRQPAGGGGGVGGGSLVMSLDDGKSGKPKLFSFVNEGNIRNLAYLLKDESPERVALVLSYLKSDWASFVLSQLPADLQSKVAVELGSVKQLEPDDVEIMELELKKKIDYLIGGAAEIIELCERSDKQTAEHILSALAVSNPQLFEQVKSQLLEINDLNYIDSIGLRILFREIPLPSWAIGLKAANKSTREKILKTLPQGAAEMLKQEIELNQMVPQIRINEEERKIILIMRRFRNEGRITIVKGEKGGEIPQEKQPEVKQESGITIEKEKTETETREKRLARIKERLRQKPPPPEEIEPVPTLTEDETEPILTPSVEEQPSSPPAPEELKTEPREKRLARIKEQLRQKPPPPEEIEPVPTPTEEETEPILTPSVEEQTLAPEELNTETREERLARIKERLRKERGI